MTVGLIVLMIAALSGVSARRAHAQSPGFVQDPPNTPCAPNFASLTATRTFLHPGESTTLEWTILGPANCGMPMLYLRNAATGQSMPVDAVDGTTVTPAATTTYVIGTLQLNLAQITITVAPEGPAGLPLVVVTANNQQALFVQALASPNTEVLVQDHVELDLSAYRIAIPIAHGVRLRGTRGGRQRGARLYIRSDAARTNGEPLFRVMGDGVSIMGLRIDGGGRDDSPGSSSIGIVADSRRSLSIFQNEIYGWAVAAVKLSDVEQPGVIYYAPVVSNNDFHHNRGHGIHLSDGGYAEINANVFDGPGLAVAAGGSPAPGYTAWQNLVLERSGGFDAAGLYFAVSRNAFYNTSGPVFTLRAAAPSGAFVLRNVYGGPGTVPNEYVGPGLIMDDNIRLAAEQSACDFDGDGRDDLFLTTGRTWWINNGGDRHWILLWVSAETARLMLSDVSLGDVTGDGRCDVYTDVVLYTTDKNPTQSPGTTSRQPQ